MTPHASRASAAPAGRTPRRRPTDIAAPTGTAAPGVGRLMLSRRAALLGLGGLTAATVGLTWSGAGRAYAAEAPPTTTLDVLSRPGTVRRVRVAVEIRGELKMNPTERGMERLPLTVDAELLYDERALTPSAGGLGRGIRAYEKAQANFKIGDAGTSSRTVTVPSILVASDPAESIALACPTHLLSREELELIDVPGSSTLWANLVPTGPVAVGTTTKIGNELAAKLFGLDVVHDSGVAVVVDAVADGRADLRLSGHVSGSVEGVSSEIDVAGTVSVDRIKLAVAAVALTMKEVRAIGHAQPGYDATITIRMASVPVPTPEKLSDAAIAGIALPLPETMRLLRWHGTLTHVRLIHDRRWRMMTESPEMAVLRMVDRGELIAQVNVAILPNLKEGEVIGVDAFEKEVKAKLADHAPLIKARSEFTNQRGLTGLRLAVEGRVQEMPIRWVYYHLHGADRRRASLIFVHDQQVTARFGEADNWLAQSLEFMPIPAGQPMPGEGVQTASGLRSVLKR